MFINFWYVADESKNITDKPVKKMMLGQNFVLFRDSKGKVHCLSDVCIHRGGSLSGGKIVKDCVQCPYHGWQFNGAGKCQQIPSLGKNAKIPSRAKIDSYPTKEVYGLVFCFLGDVPEKERCPIMKVGEYEQEGWRTTMQYFQFDIDYKRSIENGIDGAHNEFVHPTHGFSGEDEEYKSPPIDMKSTKWGTGFWSKMYAPPLKEKKMREASGRDKNAVMEAGTGHHGISMLWTHIHPTAQVFIHQYMYETPIDEDRTNLYLINTRNFLTDPEHDETVMERNQVGAFQDRDVLSGLHPPLTPETTKNEFFVTMDKPIKRYRDLLDDWENKGWRINTEEVRKNQKTHAYAIPSPARRRSKGWVLDSIPLIKS